MLSGTGSVKKQIKNQFKTEQHLKWLKLSGNDRRTTKWRHHEALYPHAPQGNEGLPNTSVLTLQHSSPGGKCPGPACTIPIGPFWADGTKWLWNKHKAEHHFCSEWQCRQCLTPWICPRTHDSSSSWDWRLTCLFSITNALDIFTAVLNWSASHISYIPQQTAHS